MVLEREREGFINALLRHPRVSARALPG
jgi:hypothetical protein